jgi:hypothetical protein
MTQPSLSWPIALLYASLRLAVARLHRDEREQTRRDRTDRARLDLDARFADTLDQSDHRGRGEGQGRTRGLIDMVQSGSAERLWCRMGTRPAQRSRCLESSHDP